MTVNPDRSVTITLPHAQLAKPVLDTAASHVVDRDRGLLDRLGSVFTESPTGEQSLYAAAEPKLRAAANESGLIAKADENTTQMLTRFLDALGFDKVTITCRKTPPSRRLSVAGRAGEAKVAEADGGQDEGYGGDDQQPDDGVAAFGDTGRGGGCCRRRGRSRRRRPGPPSPGDHWASPDRAVASSRSRRTTKPSDQTTARRVRAPSSTNTRDVGGRPDGRRQSQRADGARYAGDQRRQAEGDHDDHQRHDEPGQPAAGHDRGERGGGEPGEVQRPRADLGAEDGVADHEAPHRQHDPEQPRAGYLGQRHRRPVGKQLGQHGEEQRSRRRAAPTRPDAWWGSRP